MKTWVIEVVAYAEVQRFVEVDALDEESAKRLAEALATNDNNKNGSPDWKLTSKLKKPGAVKEITSVNGWEKE